MKVEKDFEELLGLFNKHKVKYCIIGAFAVGFHGYPRYTKDMDIFIEPSLKNGQNIVKALIEFGFGSLKLTPQDFTAKGAIIQLGYEPVRVDLINSIKGCDFSQAWAHREAGRYGKYKVFFMGVDELIKTKKSANRQQDRLDTELLQKRLSKIKR